MRATTREETQRGEYLEIHIRPRHEEEFMAEQNRQGNSVVDIVTIQTKSGARRVAVVEPI